MNFSCLYSVLYFFEFRLNYVNVFRLRSPGGILLSDFLKKLVEFTTFSYQQRLIMPSSDINLTFFHLSTVGRLLFFKLCFFVLFGYALWWWIVSVWGIIFNFRVKPRSFIIYIIYLCWIYDGSYSHWPAPPVQFFEFHHFIHLQQNQWVPFLNFFLLQDHNPFSLFDLWNIYYACLRLFMKSTSCLNPHTVIVLFRFDMNRFIILSHRRFIFKEIIFFRSFTLKLSPELFAMEHLLNSLLKFYLLIVFIRKLSFHNACLFWRILFHSIDNKFD